MELIADKLIQLHVILKYFEEFHSKGLKLAYCIVIFHFLFFFLQVNELTSLLPWSNYTL